jgi:hypothetical protein
LFQHLAECPATVVGRRDVHKVNCKSVFFWVFHFRPFTWKKWMPHQYKGGFLLFWFVLPGNYIVLSVLYCYVSLYFSTHYGTLLHFSLVLIVFHMFRIYTYFVVIKEESSTLFCAVLGNGVRPFLIHNLLYIVIWHSLTVWYIIIINKCIIHGFC